MNIGTYLYLIFLFVVFSPGIILSIPFGGEKYKWVRVFTHGFLFSVVWLLTHKPVNNMYSSIIREGIDNTVTIINGDTAVVNNTGTTPYTEPPPRPIPTVDGIDSILIRSNQPYLSLAEVQVFDQSGKNVALGKKTTQSSTGWGGDSKRAVDGNTSGSWNSGTTTHTDYNDNTPWWRVDLGGKYTIKQIVIYNRTDCCSERLNDATLYLITDNQVGRKVKLRSDYPRVQSFNF